MFFNIFFYPLNRKLSIFYVEKDIFQKVTEIFSVEIECERVDAPPFLRAVLRGTARGLRPPRCQYNNLL